MIKMKYKKRKVYIMKKFIDYKFEDVLHELYKLPETILSLILKEYTLDENDTSLKEPLTKQEKYIVNREISRIEKNTKIYIMNEFLGYELKEVLKKLSFLPGGVLKTILKEYTLKNEKTFKEPLSPEEKVLIKDELKKIKRSLNCIDNGLRNDYKPFFSIFDGTKEEVLLILSTLTEKEKALLYLRYDKDFMNTKYRENITKKETSQIRAVIRTIKRRLENYKSGNYKIVSIEDLIEGVPLKRIQIAVATLPKTQKEAFYGFFGKSLDVKAIVKKDSINSSISNKSIEKLKEKLFGTTTDFQDYKPFVKRFDDIRIENETDDELLERIKPNFIYLKKHQIDLLYKKYGIDLKSTKYNKTITKSEHIIISNTVNYLKAILMDKKEIFQCKPLINRFDELTTLGDIFREIECLTEEEQHTLKAKYGPDYLGTTDIQAFDDRFNYSVKLVIEKMQKRINRKRRDESKISLFTLRRILKLTKTEEYQNLKQVIGINPTLAVLAKKYFGDEYSTESISALTGVDTLYIIDVTKAYILFEKEIQRKLEKEDIKVLKHRIGE